MTCEVTVIYGTPEEVCLEIDGTPILIRGTDIEFVQVEEEVVYPNEEYG